MAVLTEDHEELHQDNAEQQTIDDNIPDALEKKSQRSAPSIKSRTYAAAFDF